MCPFTQKPCTKECKLYQQRDTVDYSGCAFNLIADYAVSEVIKKDVERQARHDLLHRPPKT